MPGRFGAALAPRCKLLVGFYVDPVPFGDGIAPPAGGTFYRSGASHEQHTGLRVHLE